VRRTQSIQRRRADPAYRFRVAEEVLKADQQPIPIVKLLFALPSPLSLIPPSIAIGANVTSTVELVAATLPVICIIPDHIALVTSSISFSWLTHDGTRKLPAMHMP